MRQLLVLRRAVSWNLRQSQLNTALLALLTLALIASRCFRITRASLALELVQMLTIRFPIRLLLGHLLRVLTLRLVTVPHPLQPTFLVSVVRLSANLLHSLFIRLDPLALRLSNVLAIRLSPCTLPFTLSVALRSSLSLSRRIVPVVLSVLLRVLSDPLALVLPQLVGVGLSVCSTLLLSANPRFFLRVHCRYSLELNSSNALIVRCLC